MSNAGNNTEAESKEMAFYNKMHFNIKATQTMISTLNSQKRDMHGEVVFHEFATTISVIEGTLLHFQLVYYNSQMLIM